MFITNCKYKNFIKINSHLWASVVLVCFVLAGTCGNLFAKPANGVSNPAPETSAAGTPESPKVETPDNTSMDMLLSLLEFKKSLEGRISQKKAQLEKSSSETEKAELTEELAKLDEALAGANTDFERIATGIDIGIFAQKKDEKFNWEDELVSLVEPGIMELKQLTARARHKTKLKDQIAYYVSALPVATKAGENLKTMIDKAKDKELKESLQALVPEWEGVQSQVKSKLEVIEMELDKIEAKDQSLLESGQTSIKKFFRTRGLFLLIAVLACVCLVLCLRFLHRRVIAVVPGYSKKYQPFHVKAIGLVFSVLTLVLSIFVLILVFYLFEDWVLLSMVILLLAGLIWTAKNTLPGYVEQARLILNIGPVREGERLVLNGIPWLVKNINMYSILENPDLDITLRVPIAELMDKTSREFKSYEPWFPCRKDDWVILSDGIRGCVTSLSHEMVELVQRGGARKTYQTGDFLSLAPLNLSANFRLKILFGISYDLQAECTGRILEILDQTIRKRIQEEGYEDSLLNLRVEFAQAGGSSLDFVVISDFKGDMAPLYNRLNRAIQRWCVDACTENNWEIPFPQVTVHKGG